MVEADGVEDVAEGESSEERWGCEERVGGGSIMKIGEGRALRDIAAD